MLASVLRPLHLNHRPRHARARPRPALGRHVWSQARREDKDNAGGEESDALQEEGGYGNGRNRPNTSGQWVAYQKHTPENLGAWYTYIKTNYVSASQARVSRKTLYTRAFV